MNPQLNDSSPIHRAIAFRKEAWGGMTFRDGSWMTPLRVQRRLKWEGILSSSWYFQSSWLARYQEASFKSNWCPDVSYPKVRHPGTTICKDRHRITEEREHISKLRHIALWHSLDGRQMAHFKVALLVPFVLEDTVGRCLAICCKLSRWEQSCFAIALMCTVGGVGIQQEIHQPRRNIIKNLIHQNTELFSQYERKQEVHC